MTSLFLSCSQHQRYLVKLIFFPTVVKLKYDLLIYTCAVEIEHKMYNVVFSFVYEAIGQIKREQKETGKNNEHQAISISQVLTYAPSVQL